MKTGVNKLYEGMFLVDSAVAASDWDGINTTIKNILEKAQAEIVSVRKWDERKLAYKIKGKTRGTYILSYFKAPGVSIKQIEREVQLSEQIMRILILNAEQMEQKDIEKETPAMLAEKQSQEVAKEQKAEDGEQKTEDGERKAKDGEQGTEESVAPEQ